jgi:hypothetical protein
MISISQIILSDYLSKFQIHSSPFFADVDTDLLMIKK